VVIVPLSGLSQYIRVVTALLAPAKRFREVPIQQKQGAAMQLRVRLVGVVLWSLLGVAPAALASMVGTDEVLAASEAVQTRERVKQLVQRPELAKQLEALGIPQTQAAERVDAMTDAEVLAMEGKLGTLPAGGAISDNELILILVIVVLIIAL
jgi:hypothetical protein